MQHYYVPHELPFPLFVYLSFCSSLCSVSYLFIILQVAPISLSLSLVRFSLTLSSLTLSILLTLSICLFPLHLSLLSLILSMYLSFVCSFTSPHFFISCFALCTSSFCLPSLLASLLISPLFLFKSSPTFSFLSFPPVTYEVSLVLDCCSFS